MNCGTACSTSVPAGASVSSPGNEQTRGEVDHNAAPFRWSDWSTKISRLAAPREDGAKLIEPPLSFAGDMVRANQRDIAAADYDVQGRRLSQLAAEARQQLLAEALQFTRGYRDFTLPADTSKIFLAGHQPEMFHPGVWFKNFALARLAQQHQAVAVNLLIDSDAVKSVALRVPGGSIEDPRIESVPFDKAESTAPFEHRDIADRDLFASFGARVQKQLGPLVADPIITKYWPLAVARSRTTNNLGACLSQARHQLEASAWGLQTLEIPQSRVCDLPAMHWFIAHLLAHLPRLWEIYNSALAEYRRQHKTRSAAHPAPDLTAEGDSLEAPFWIWSADDPQRHRLFVRQRGDELVLTAHAGIEAALSITPESDAQTAAAQLLALAQRGIRIRTRALVTTLAARLLLGDLFLHGIGGAKYDHVTDRLITDFFGLQPPGYMAVSGTLHLPVSQPAAHGDDLLQLRQRIRDLEFHPERFVDRLPAAKAGAAAGGDAARWIDEKRRWIATPQTPENARARCHAIRQANEALQSAVDPLRLQWTAAADQIAEKRHQAAVLASRDYAFVLFPELLLTKFFG